LNLECGIASKQQAPPTLKLNHAKSLKITIITIEIQTFCPFGLKKQFLTHLHINRALLKNQGTTYFQKMYDVFPKKISIPNIAIH
jgi:hypothetical protein